MADEAEVGDEISEVGRRTLVKEGFGDFCFMIAAKDELRLESMG